jgi:sRNA-binding carbon storage regulator CsrA
VGITDPKEVEIFRSIISPLVLREQNLHLEKGELRAEELASSTLSFSTLRELVWETIVMSHG